jgi:hypothetical protein
MTALVEHHQRISASPSIHPNAVYDPQSVAAALELPEAIIDHDIDLGKLRCSKRAGRHFIIGQWLLDWVEAAELKNGQQELCFNVLDPNDDPLATDTAESTVETKATDSGGDHREPQIESACQILTVQQHNFADDEIQETYRMEYIRQLKQRSCPGCGEGEQLF